MSTRHQSVSKHLGLLRFVQGQTESEGQNQHLSVNHPNPTITPELLDHSPSASDTTSHFIGSQVAGRKACPEPATPRMFKMWFYQRNLSTGATNYKCNALVLEIRLSVAKRTCGESRGLFDPPAAAGFCPAAPAGSAAGAHGVRQAELAPTPDRPLAPGFSKLPPEWYPHDIISLTFYPWQKASSHNINGACNRHLKSKYFWEKNGRKHGLGKSN